jgi:hypothetical protein
MAKATVGMEQKRSTKEPIGILELMAKLEKVWKGLVERLARASCMLGQFSDT